MDIVELRSVTIAEKQQLWKLMQEYLGGEPFEGSEKFKDEQGDWKYPHFDSYWEQPTRHPFFIQRKGEQCGFVLVRELIPDELCSVAEFYVFPAYWRRGIGTRTMQLVQERFPYKKWKISYLYHNLRAAGFWKHWTDASGCDVELEEVHPIRDES
jgi:predicted acetyltransferase